MPGPKVVGSQQNAGPIPLSASWIDKGIAGYRARKSTEADEKKNMATLIAQLAQVGMIKPGGKTGDENTLSAYGQNFQIVTKAEDKTDIRQQQLIDKERKLTGEIPMTKYEIRNTARESHLEYLESEEWAREKFILQDRYENDPAGYAKAIGEAEKQNYQDHYNSVLDIQKQFHPNAFAEANHDKKPPPIGQDGEFEKESDQVGYLKDISDKGKGKGLEIPKSFAQIGSQMLSRSKQPLREGSVLTPNDIVSYEKRRQLSHQYPKSYSPPDVQMRDNIDPNNPLRQGFRALGEGFNTAGSFYKDLYTNPAPPRPPTQEEMFRKTVEERYGGPQGYADQNNPGQ